MRITKYLLFFLSLYGCATMVYGNRQDMQFTSQPSGQQIEMNEQKCLTPCSLSVPRGEVPMRLKVDGEYMGEVIPAPLQAGNEPGAATLQVLGAFLVVPALIDQGNGMLVSWPKSIHIAKGKMEVAR